MINQDNSQTIKAGSITYFFDVKETRQGKPYLVITMSRFKGEGEDRDRVSIPLFPEHVRTFVKVFLEMAQNLPLPTNESAMPSDDVDYTPRQQPIARQLTLRGTRTTPIRPTAAGIRRRA